MNGLQFCGGPIHTGRGTRRTTRRKQMGPVDVNGGVHTARKQHQRKNIPICTCVMSRVLCELGLRDSEGLDTCQKVGTSSPSGEFFGLPEQPSGHTTMAESCLHCHWLNTGSTPRLKCEVPEVNTHA